MQMRYSGRCSGFSTTVDGCRTTRIGLSRALGALVVCLVGAVVAGGGSASASAPSGVTRGESTGRNGVACETRPGLQDRLDAAAGKQVHVVYAVPADGPNRFAEVAPLVAADLEAVVRWWQREDPLRLPRLDIVDRACAPNSNGLDMSSVRLEQPAASYAPVVGRAAALFAAIRHERFGLDHPFKKYLAYYDGPVDRGPCGHAGRSEQHSSVGLVYIHACGSESLGHGGFLAQVAAHELLHTLGAAPVGAPNACARGDAHVCDSPSDVLYPGGVKLLADAILDVGDDDYYGHSGNWFDARDSPFLRRLDAPTYRLAASVAGSTDAGARIESDLPGVACPPVCGLDWEAGTAVTLAAVGSRRAQFKFWSGACTGVEPKCSLTVEGATTVTAHFAIRRYRLSITLRGRGAVRVSGRTRLVCRRDCHFTLPYGAVVRLTARPTRGFVFQRWHGPCPRKATCALRLTSRRTINAVFIRKSATTGQQTPN